MGSSGELVPNIGDILHDPGQHDSDDTELELLW